MPVTATPITPGLDLPSLRSPLGSRFEVLVAPTSRVVTADQLGRQCRISSEDRGIAGTDDATLNLYIDAATDYAETRLETSLAPRTIRGVFNENQPIDLRYGPVIEIVEVAGKGQSPTTDYEVMNFGYTCRIVPTGSIRYPVFVNYRAGHISTEGTSPAVPPAIAAAILQHAATMFENRASVTDATKNPLPHSLEMFYAAKDRGTGVG